MDKKISFSEEFLSGYLDGELSEEDAIKVHQFASSSIDLREDLLSLSKIGEIFSSNFQSAPDDLNTWQAIESRLTLRKPSEIESKIERRVPVEEIKETVGFWSSLFHPGYATALAFVLVAVGMISSQWVELPSNKVATSTAKINESDISLEKNKVLVPLIPNNPEMAPRTFVSNNSSSQSNDIHYSPQFISPQQLGAEHPARGSGVRADGMQVEWMRNSRAVRFLRHNDESLPPTIWLGDLR